MFDDLYHHARQNELAQRHSELKGDTSNLGHDLLDLRKLVAKMALANQALYELMRAHTGITDEELRRKMREIDRRDGVEDGKLSAAPLKCPKCYSAVTAGALKCPSCGATVAPKYPFEA